MIVNSLCGGLGNQLFQIAAGFSHAIKVNSEFAINYDLFLTVGQGYKNLRYKDTLYKNIPETDRNDFVPYREPRYSYCPILNLDNLRLIGYFQSSKYFKDYEKEVKTLFQFPEYTVKKIKKKMRNIKKPKVGVHVRLGDYLHTNLHGVFHKINYQEYLKRAMSHFKEDVEFLFFSDDKQFLKNISINKNFTCLNNEDEVEDLFALSECDSIIMSNSSFSWWGVFLGKTKDTVICPIKWYGPKGPQDYQDLYEDKWVRLSDTII
ncbi:MAG: hypothetical protein CMM98_03955 [Rickettsiales bacterium]|nr:hypothetical protein [Rickettsiales bacterium]